MKLVEPSYMILSIPDYAHALDVVEAAIRVCKKSPVSTDIGVKEDLVRRIINAGHLSTLEHQSITVHFVTGRGTTHELVRHRIASYSQESSRFCNYSDDKFGEEISVIRPYWFSREEWNEYRKRQDSLEGYTPNIPVERLDQLSRWEYSIECAQSAYLALIDKENVKEVPPLPAQAARGVLPTDLKTEIIMSANIRQWRYIFELRVLGKTGNPHPDMKLLLKPLLQELQTRLPVFFEEL